ncbi:MAG: DUF58 domain-containing protein [Planctomycetota bacterium]
MSLLRVFKSSDKSKSTKEIDVFSEEFIKKLEKLRFVVKKILFSGTVGEQIMRQKGGRLEFAGHRDYTHGDETRYIDWNAFARLERLYIKEFSQEQSIPLYILLDISTSMLSTNIQRPARLLRSGGDVISKIDYAKQLAVVIGYIGLITGQPVRLFTFSQDSFHTSEIFESDKQLFEMMTFLRKLRAVGQTNIYDACTRFDKIINKKGFFILLSDLFENRGEDSHQILERLNSRGFIINIMHIFSGFDEIPRLSGLYKLRDLESGEEKVVWIDNKTISTYQHTFSSFSEGWNSFCLKHNIKYFYLNTRTSLEDVVFRLLRQRGLLR